MSADMPRRGFLALGAAGSAAAAVGGGARPVVARLFPGFTSRMTVGAMGSALRAATPLDREIPGRLGQLAGELERVTAAAGCDPADVLAQMEAEARAMAALAPVFPPEIAAYRSFAPHLRRRLYAELLARESARHAAAPAPPPTPPAPTGPDA